MGTMMKRLLTLTAVALSFSGAASASDLMAVYQRALQNDPQLREAEDTRLAALESKPQALAALLPQLSAATAAAAQALQLDAETARKIAMFGLDGGK